MATATAQLTVGSKVKLNTPDNPRLHGQFGTVRELTEWGAHVTTAAAAARTYRAGWDEMVPVAEGQGYTGDACECCGGFRMVRSGACAVCLDCGTSGGCG